MLGYDMEISASDKSKSNSLKYRKLRREGQRISKRRAIYGAVINLMMIALIAVALYNIGRSINQTSQKLEVYEQAVKEVDQLRLENLELVLKSEMVRSDSYIETQARDRLKYAREGEVAYVIDPQALDDPALDRYIKSFSPGYEEEVMVASQDNWQVWLDFLVGQN